MPDLWRDRERESTIAARIFLHSRWQIDHNYIDTFCRYSLKSVVSLVKTRLGLSWLGTPRFYCLMSDNALIANCHKRHYEANRQRGGTVEGGEREREWDSLYYNRYRLRYLHIISTYSIFCAHCCCFDENMGASRCGDLSSDFVCKACNVLRHM